MIVKKVVANELSGWKVEQRIRDIFDEKFSATVTSGIESELMARNPEKMQQKIAGLVDETMKRRVILALNPFSGKWFWQTTGTATDDGKGDGMEYDDPVACAVVCEMTFGSTKTYEPLRRNEGWVPGIA